MWIKVDDEFRFGDRLALAVIDREILTDAGIGTSLRRLLSSDFSEPFVRRLLGLRYSDVSSWQLHVARYDIHRNRIEIQVSSPEFAEVPDGGYIPPVHSSFYVR